MYFVCILTSPQQRAWRCGDTWIMHGSHNTPRLGGIPPKYILIHDQIHVSVRGVSAPFWGGIGTIPGKASKHASKREGENACVVRARVSVRARVQSARRLPLRVSVRARVRVHALARAARAAIDHLFRFSYPGSGFSPKEMVKPSLGGESETRARKAIKRWGWVMYIYELYYIYIYIDG